MQNLNSYLPARDTEPSQTEFAPITRLPADAPSNRPTVDERWVLAFMERMRELYQDVWTRRLEADYDQVKEDYAKTLAELTGEEIRKGLELAKAESRFPPTPAEFYQLAKRKGLEQGVNGQAYKPLPSVAGQLPKKRSEAEKTAAAEVLGRMREVLAQKESARKPVEAPHDPRDLVPDDVWFSARGWGKVHNPVAVVREQLRQQRERDGVMAQGGDL